MNEMMDEKEFKSSKTFAILNDSIPDVEGDKMSGYEALNIIAENPTMKNTFGIRKGTLGKNSSIRNANLISKKKMRRLLKAARHVSSSMKNLIGRK